VLTEALEIFFFARIVQEKVNFEVIRGLFLLYDCPVKLVVVEVKLSEV